MSKQIRILHFLNYLEGGGAERQVKLLLGGMSAARFTNAICCVDKTGRDGLNPQIEVFEIRKRSRFDLRWDRIFKLARQWRPDIVHIWVPVVLPSVVAPVRWAGVRRLVGAYRNVYEFDNWQRIFQVLLFQATDRIVSNVQPGSLRPPYRNIFHNKRGQVIPNSVDLDVIAATQPLPLTELGCPDDLPVFLYVGRLVEHKNVAALLEAFADFRRRSGVARLLICGSGPMEPILRQRAAESDLAGAVIFAGYQAQIYAIMKSCFALVQPSQHEGMPNVVFEAMSAGLPVLLSDISVHRDWFGQNSYAVFFDPAKPEEMAQSMLRFSQWTPEQRRSLTVAATEYMHGFHIQRMTASYEAFYSDLVQEIV